MRLSKRLRHILIWGGLVSAILAPIAAAANSPLLQWREPIYIIAGFAGIIAMAMLLLQPLLAISAIPGLSPHMSRRVHRYGGMALVLAVVVHVVGLWMTSPPDVIDVLLFRSPTPFAIWGALAIWAVFGAALLAFWRVRLPLRVWRWGHTVLVSLAVVGTVVHAVQIIGTMETLTKSALSVLVVAALLLAIARRRVWTMGVQPRRR